MNTNNEETQSKAFDVLLKLSKEASLEILVVTDNDVEIALEGDDEALAQLTPDVLRKIKRDVIDELHENFQHAMQNAISNYIK
jgi:hypothetical protein